MNTVFNGCYEEWKSVEIIFDKSYFYILELDKERIKIGISDSINNRINTHQAANMCYAGKSIQRMLIIETSNNDNLENLMKIALRKEFVNVGNEFFVCSYESAILTLKNVALFDILDLPVIDETLFVYKKSVSVRNKFNELNDQMLATALKEWFEYANLDKKNFFTQNPVAAVLKTELKKNDRWKNKGNKGNPNPVKFEKVATNINL